MGLVQFHRRRDNVGQGAQAKKVAKDFIPAQFLIVEPPNP